MTVRRSSLALAAAGLAAARVGAPALLLAVALLSGCGGGHQSRANAPRGAGPEPGSEESPKGGAAEADRIAYYQLATAAGFLNASAAAARSRASAPDRALAELPAAGQRLTKLRPRDSALQSAARALAVAIARWLAAASSPQRRQAAGQALAATNRVEAELRKFLRRHRALSGAIPD